MPSPNFPRPMTISLWSVCDILTPSAQCPPKDVKLSPVRSVIVGLYCCTGISIYRDYYVLKLKFRPQHCVSQWLRPLWRQRKTTLTEDGLNERPPLWKTASLEEGHEGRLPQRKIVSTEDGLNGRRPR